MRSAQVLVHSRTIQLSTFKLFFYLGVIHSKILADIDDAFLPISPEFLADGLWWSSEWRGNCQREFNRW